MMQAVQRDRDAMRAVLTADQQTTFDANLARLRERMRARMQGGPGGRR
jgi:Spy/CpxP family protein refolding chaperone